MRYFHALVLFLSMFWLSCSQDDSNYFQKERINEIINRLNSQPINEYTVFRAPTYPKKIKRVVTPWDPVEALVVALPYQDAISNSKILRFYMTIVAHAVRVTDVILLVNERELYDVKAILNHLTSFNLDRYLFSSNGHKHQIRIVPARFNTKWIRDYGSFFVFDAQGNICVVDAINTDVRSEISPTEHVSINDFFNVDVLSLVGAQKRESEGKVESNKRNEDDTATMYLTNYLYQKHGYDIPIIRVPIQLQGGDVFADGSKNLFISSESLLINGGHRVDLELILKSYFGIKAVTYLEPFPGDTVKHLDMIFMPLGSDRLLVADYPADASNDDIYMQYLHRETKRILDFNVTRLQRAFPQRHIVKIPMPPIERRSKLDDALLTLTKTLFSARNYQSPPGLISTPERWNAYNFVFLCHVLSQYRKLKPKNETGQLFKILGPFENDYFSSEYEAVLNRCVDRLLNNDSHLLEWIAESYRMLLKGSKYENLSYEKLLNKLLTDYLRAGVEEDPSNYFYVYRSYLNATYINGVSGRMLLVPSYSGYQELERKVHEIYKELFPETEIVFINSDEIIKQYGAIHCVTMTVPDFQRN